MLSKSYFLDKEEAEARRVRACLRVANRARIQTQAPEPEPSATALCCGIEGAVVAQCISVKWMKTGRLACVEGKSSSRGPILLLSLLCWFPSLLLHHCCCFRSETLCGPGGKREDSSERPIPLSCLPPLQVRQRASWDGSVCLPSLSSQSQPDKNGVGRSRKGGVGVVPSSGSLDSGTCASPDSVDRMCL